MICFQAVKKVDSFFGMKYYIRLKQKLVIN